MPNITTDIDTTSRNRIVSETDKNYFVEAGAGSGKTTMLVNRMVAMVEQGKEIDRICAITFTKAAAGEFYERFQKILIDRSSDSYVWVDKGHAGQLPKPTEETKERCRKALKDINLCFMGTIDSFCGMVLSEHPSEAGIPSDSTIMSDADAASLYKREFVKICEGKYGRNLLELAKSFRGLHWNAENVFVEGMKLIMDHRNSEIHFTQMAPINIDNYFRVERQNIINALACLMNHPELKYVHTTSSIRAWDALGDAYNAVRTRWSSNYSGVIRALDKIRYIRLTENALTDYGASLSPEFRLTGKGSYHWCVLTAGESGGVIDSLLEIQYSITMTFLMKCVQVIENAMRDLGAFTYFDYLYYLRNMLKSDAANGGKLIKYIYDRHSYFLIDEFQDTNPMQAEVFFYLSAENPVAKWTDCIPRQGSLFIVGDPKQSIYRFRSADVTSFLNVKKLFENAGGEILKLSRNFRSTRQLCTHFNESFTRMLPEETQTQSKYQEIPLPDETTGEFQGVYKYTAYVGALEDQYPDKTNPVQIGKIICSIVNNPNVKIRTANDVEPRMVRFSDFMVITYGKSKLAGIRERLDELGIPTRVEGKVPFESNEALAEVFRIYRSAADINDSLAMYGALTGKLIGHLRGDILTYKASGGKIKAGAALDHSTVTDSKAISVESSIRKLEELSKDAQILSPAALMSEIIDAFEIYRIVSSENMEVVYYTLELMRKAEKTGIINNLKDGADYIQTLLNGESEEERCLSLNESQDRVHMANLHKVKGLEAPFVILSAATMAVNDASHRFTHEDDKSEGYIFSLKEKSKGYYYLFRTNGFIDEKEAESEAINDENKRLVYVAGTRARNVLIICDSIQKSRLGEEHRSIWKPLMESDTTDIFTALGQTKNSIIINHTAADSKDLYEKAVDECAFNDRSSEAKTFTVQNPSHTRIGSKLSDTEEIIMDDDTEKVEEAENKDLVDERVSAIVHRFPTLLGTMTHKLMEMIVATKNTLDTDSAVDEIIREYRTAENAAYESELACALKQVAETMRGGGYSQDGDTVKDILSELLSADEVYCETPFCYREETDTETLIWNGIMDVIYYKEGKWHIIDYKTNIDGNDLDVKYQAQLDAYIRAFKEITGNEADAKTYHIDI